MILYYTYVVVSFYMRSSLFPYQAIRNIPHACCKYTMNIVPVADIAVIPMTKAALAWKDIK